MRLCLCLISGLLFVVSVVSACNRQFRSCLLVLDGVSVSETPSLLVEMEALRVPVALSVSLQDLRDFVSVRLIVSEAVHRGHFILLASPDHVISQEVKAEFSVHVGGYALQRTSASVPYNLDLSPDHITAVPQLIQDRVSETPSIGRIIYLNSFVANAKDKAISAVRSYQNSGFQFISLPECLNISV